ncbi:MAG TPA: hypothetical protein DCO83_17245 [Mucilaginibacter sp.]|nr:hypothetical protein [Mucilaginibacter sp.]
MKDYIEVDEWRIIEQGFNPHHNKVSESIFSLGNGRMGQRANFEEAYSGETLQGNYIAGVYYPDKTRVGWWKNGYPEYFAKVLNAANWIGIDILIDGEQLDLAKCEVISFRRELNMKAGYLKRNFTAKTVNGKQVEVESIRFCSMADDETGAIKYSITPLNFDGTLIITPFIDGDIANKDSNYDEKFWDEVKKETWVNGGYVQLRTKKTGFEVATGMQFSILQRGKTTSPITQPIEKEKYIAAKVEVPVTKGQSITLIKYAANLSSQNYKAAELAGNLKQTLSQISEKGFETMLAEQAGTWAKKWEHNDIIIEGDAGGPAGYPF